MYQIVDRGQVVDRAESMDEVVWLLTNQYCLLSHRVFSVVTPDGEMMGFSAFPQSDGRWYFDDAPSANCLV